MAVKASRKSLTEKSLGRYLYAVVDGERDIKLGECCGVDGNSVYVISEQGVSAVVSDLANTRLRPERRRLAAHHDVLKRLMAEHTVLPMSFGIVASGPDAICKILRKNRTTLLEQLRRVAGKIEMGLRVVWDVPNIFEYFVLTHNELRTLRDYVFRGGREPTQEDKIELGRTFDRALTEERAALTEKVVNALRPHCFEIKENQPRNERDIMNLACLIGREAQKDFEQGVFEAAGSFDNDFAFDFNGPWPPHNFVTVALHTA